MDVVVENGADLTSAAASESSLVATTLSNCSDIVLDALPYVDKYDESSQSQVYNLLREELGRTANATRVHLDDIVPYKVSFQSEALSATWERVEASGGRDPAMTGLNIEEQPLVEPSASASLEEWTAALNRAKIQFEHLRNKSELLGLSEEYGANAWIAYNARAEALKGALQEALKKLEQQIEQVNVERSTAQTSAGTKLERLWSQWREVVRKNVQIDASCQILQFEIDELTRLRNSRTATHASDGVVGVSTTNQAQTGDGMAETT